MSDTPETDDLARGNHVVPTEWAEQLERERDEAREKLDEEMKWHHRTHTELVQTQCKLLDMQMGRDEAQEELQKLEGAYEDATNYYARIIELKYELDETRKEVKYWQELYRTVSVY